ncbi:MAG TPA: hypothetical protein VMT79_21615, partial [Candidatus Binatia bacterium]|nr:hypothetical protein [Candidatus Binatia bacterium]
MERFDLAVAGDRLAGVLHRPLADRAPCVIACHGLGASKDSDKYLMLADALVCAGLALARFDFHGSGESGGRLADATCRDRWPAGGGGCRARRGRQRVQRGSGAPGRGKDSSVDRIRGPHGESIGAKPRSTAVISATARTTSADTGAIA